MALVSSAVQCMSERVECGSDMSRLYGLDFWRVDLLPTLDFSQFLDAVHSVDQFTKFCKCVVSLLCLFILRYDRAEASTRGVRRI